MARMSEASATPRRRAPRGLAAKLGAVVLGFEAVVVGLGGLTVFGLRALPAGIEPWWAIVGGGVIAIAMIITAGRVHTRGGVIAGWTLQVIVALGGFLVPAVAFIAVVFGGMWAYAMIAGGRSDREAARAQADS